MTKIDRYIEQQKRLLRKLKKARIEANRLADKANYRYLATWDKAAAKIVKAKGIYHYQAEKLLGIS